MVGIERIWIFVSAGYWWELWLPSAFLYHLGSGLEELNCRLVNLKALLPFWQGGWGTTWKPCENRSLRSPQFFFWVEIRPHFLPCSIWLEFLVSRDFVFPGSLFPSPLVKQSSFSLCLLYFLGVCNICGEKKVHRIHCSICAHLCY